MIRMRPFQIMAILCTVRVPQVLFFLDSLLVCDLFRSWRARRRLLDWSRGKAIKHLPLWAREALKLTRNSRRDQSKLQGLFNGQSTTQHLSSNPYGGEFSSATPGQLEVFI